MLGLDSIVNLSNLAGDMSIVSFPSVEFLCESSDLGGRKKPRLDFLFAFIPEGGVSIRNLRNPTLRVEVFSGVNMEFGVSIAYTPGLELCGVNPMGVSGISMLLSIVKNVGREDPLKKVDSTPSSSAVGVGNERMLTP